jgi:uncharacterized phage-like protein YoqJ
MAVCFTGHRPLKLGGYNENNPLTEKVKVVLAQKILEQYELGEREFICGGALGVDTWAAEILYDFKPHFSDIRVTIAVPCKDQDCKWPETSRRRYREMLLKADKVFFVTETTYEVNPKCMDKRNEWMVDHSQKVIAVWDGSPGGTGNCVRYAKFHQKEIININPLKLG